MATEITRENDRMLTRKQLAERLGVSYKTVEAWAATYHQTRRGPPFLQTPSPRYLLSDVIAWEESTRISVPEVPTVEAAYERSKAS